VLKSTYESKSQPVFIVRHLLEGAVPQPRGLESLTPEKHARTGVTNELHNHVPVVEIWGCNPANDPRSRVNQVEITIGKDGIWVRLEIFYRGTDGMRQKSVISTQV